MGGYSSPDTSEIQYRYLGHPRWLEKILPPSSFPGLWIRIEELIQQGDLRATEEVLHELEKRDDEVLEWAKAQDGFFVLIDQPIQTEVASVLSGFPQLVDLIPLSVLESSPDFTLTGN